MKMDSTGEQLVTGSFKFIRLWNIRTGAMIAQFEKDVATRCLVVCLPPNRKELMRVSSDSAWNVERSVMRHFLFFSSRPRAQTSWRSLGGHFR
jgi:hypothetical protein